MNRYSLSERGSREGGAAADTAAAQAPGATSGITQSWTQGGGPSRQDAASAPTWAEAASWWEATRAQGARLLQGPRVRPGQSRAEVVPGTEQPGSGKRELGADGARGAGRAGTIPQTQPQWGQRSGSEGRTDSLLTTQRPKKWGSLIPASSHTCLNSSRPVACTCKRGRLRAGGEGPGQAVPMTTASAQVLVTEDQAPPPAPRAACENLAGGGPRFIRGDRSTRAGRCGLWCPPGAPAGP